MIMKCRMNAIKGRARDPPLSHKEAMDITSSVLAKNGVSHNANLSAFDPYATKHSMEEKVKKLEEKVRMYFRVIGKIH